MGTDRRLSSFLQLSHTVTRKTCLLSAVGLIRERGLLNHILSCVFIFSFIAGISNDWVAWNATFSGVQRLSSHD